MLFLLEEFFHSGTPQRFDGDPKGSGRYRKGSGENPHQHGTGTYYTIDGNVMITDKGFVWFYMD